MRAVSVLLLAVAVAGPVRAGSWAAVEGTSADQPYSGLALAGTDAVPSADGGMRVVTFWAPPAGVSADSALAPGADGAGTDPQAVTRCVTDLGPGLAVVQDRCWQSAP